MLKRDLKPARRTEIEAELAGPPMPAAGEHLWEWFLELNAARGAGGMAMAAITYPDIAAWSALRGIRPAPWEVEILTALDRALRAEAARSAPKSDARASQQG